jgi:hypothetical protein
MDGPSTGQEKINPSRGGTGERNGNCASSLHDVQTQWMGFQHWGQAGRRQRKQKWQIERKVDSSIANDVCSLSCCHEGIYTARQIGQKTILSVSARARGSSFLKYTGN